MNPQKALAHRFREVILNGTWIANTNYKNELTTVDWVTATTKNQGLNTIALLTQHIHYYIKGVKHVFLGGKLEISDRFSFDFPAIQSQAEWERILSNFWEDAEAFAQCIEELDDAQLHAPFVDEKYGTYQRNIDGMIEHAYYHLGQIVLLKKLVQSPL